MADDNEEFSAMAGFREMAKMSSSGDPPWKPPVERPPVNSDDPRMDPLAELTTRMGKVETGIENLRHSQNVLLGVLALFLAIVVYLAQDVGGQVGDMNTRFDRFLERQADAAAAANARFDRLLEQRAAQGAAPIVIQVPGPPPMSPQREDVPSQAR